MKANGFQWLKRLGETQIGNFTMNETGYDTRTHQWFLMWLHEPLDKMQWELTPPPMKASSQAKQDQTNEHDEVSLDLTTIL